MKITTLTSILLLTLVLTALAFAHYGQDDTPMQLTGLFIYQTGLAYWAGWMAKGAEQRATDEQPANDITADAVYDATA